MSSGYRKRKRRKRQRIRLIASMCICLAAALFLGIIVYQNQKVQRSRMVTAGHSYDMGSGYRNLRYKGEHYQYNNLITSILYAGVDSTGKLKETVQYGNKARADALALVIMDKKNKKMSVVSINRDTMTEIRRYTMNGNDQGLYETHIGYAYSYGDGGRVSCQNLCEAVSLLMGGIPVNRYVVTNQDSMPYINQLAGGITVTVPNHDLEELDPELYEGAQVTLDDSNIRTFLQYRKTEDTFSNEGRMERQKAYLTSYIEKVKTMEEKELEEAWTSLDSMKEYLQTNITRNQYLGLAELLQETDFSEDQILSLPGQDQEGELHDEFYPDEEALQELILQLFYEKV